MTKDSSLLKINRIRKHVISRTEMFIETTYPSREITLAINKAVGKPYTLMERLRMGGIGSKRMAIEAVSETYSDYLNPDHYVTHANIELRPKGIVLHFRYKLESYAWVMPYANLEVEMDKKLVLKSDGLFIRFKNGLEVNSKFLEKMMGLIQNR